MEGDPESGGRPGGVDLMPPTPKEVRELLERVQKQFDEAHRRWIAEIHESNQRALAGLPPRMVRLKDWS